MSGDHGAGSGGPGGSRRYRVVEAYERAYPVPLTAAKGARLRLGRRDDEWPGWVWAEPGEGPGGWAPESWLRVEGDDGVLLRDYSAAELTVAVGHVVVGAFEESGWVWGSDERGATGWVPLSHLRAL